MLDRKPVEGTVDESPKGVIGSTELLQQGTLGRPKERVQRQLRDCHPGECKEIFSRKLQGSLHTKKSLRQSTKPQQEQQEGLIRRSGRGISKEEPLRQLQDRFRDLQTSHAKAKPLRGIPERDEGKPQTRSPDQELVLLLPEGDSAQPQDRPQQERGGTNPARVFKEPQSGVLKEESLRWPSEGISERRLQNRKREKESLRELQESLRQLQEPNREHASTEEELLRWLRLGGTEERVLGRLNYGGPKEGIDRKLQAGNSKSKSIRQRVEGVPGESHAGHVPVLQERLLCQPHRRVSQPPEKELTVFLPTAGERSPRVGLARKPHAGPIMELPEKLRRQPLGSQERVVGKSPVVVGAGSGGASIPRQRGNGRSRQLQDRLIQGRPSGGDPDEGITLISTRF